MDELGLNALRSELLEDCRVATEVVRHAYDLILQPRKLLPLLESAERVTRELPAVCQAFCQAVATRRGWTLGE